MSMLIFTEDEIRDSVQINDEIITEMEASFLDLVTKDVQMPPTMYIDIPENKGEVHVKTAYIPGFEMFALKVTSGFFKKYKFSLPSRDGLIILMNSLNGKPEAIFYDNGYLTNIRTAATGAIVAKYIANDKIDTVGIIGTGLQAEYQLKALKLVKDFQRVNVYSRSQARRQAFKQKMGKIIDAEIYMYDSAEAVAKEADLLITATPSAEPIIKTEWIKEGTHITAIGADTEHKQELEANLLAKANVLVCDDMKQCRLIGELRAALAENVLRDTGHVKELGEIIARKQHARKSNKEITIADLTGTGVQDTKIALYAYRKLTEEK